ncbi:hypothetical protein C9374_004959 [Naegleria lovaniensis]|uniref:Uncharacterized protein n=1 Tax=Naegleria lovaniensis TaxID=51637 RepID=A0AA88GR46_NAELO|nr:uncharacterized protein C9374_004959 [Naegleria lovaniensis]KAG2382992.1 hypothetical protein C9374_004959 [Naegleria lovaniensis]
MFQRTRVLLGGLVWKQKRFNQLRKRRAREYQNRVMDVENSLKYPYAELSAPAGATSPLANFDINNSNQINEVIQRVQKATQSPISHLASVFPRK